ncbi:hypothetical protein [Mycoplasma sp. HS2188]|uniref:hypothetical protein n=1 Tax=Mycoplasma sp. HS2188 TaxID=2976765 RepID=UPI0021AAE307|nr:hypothetical protein [Mycoplasma sp. HS2188]MCT4469660.1 hypothetical protein [Mycoplasma sp. HS2188]
MKKSNYEINKRYQLEYIKNNPNTTARTLSLALNISTKTIYYNLRKQLANDNEITITHKNSTNQYSRKISISQIGLIIEHYYSILKEIYKDKYLNFYLNLRYFYKYELPENLRTIWHMQVWLRI